MKADNMNPIRLEVGKKFRIWMFLGTLLGVLTWCAAVGIQPVRANSGCTADQCSSAQQQAVANCYFRGGLAAFVCSVDGDDFGYVCNDGFHEQLDCATWNPS